MAAIKVNKPETYPGHTVWGSHDECVYVGDHVLGNEKQPGCSVYLSEREINDSCKAMWGATYTAVIERLAATEDALAEQAEKTRLLSQQLEEAGKQLEAFQIVKDALTTKEKVAA